MKPCPICGDTGPWAHGGARAAHIRSHHETECPECGQTVNTIGLASHHRYIHGVPGKSGRTRRSQPAAPTPEPEATPEAAPAAPAPEPVEPPRYVRCPDCGKACRAGPGLEIHRTAMHRPAPLRAQPTGPARRRAGRPLADALHHLVPGAADELLVTLTGFVDKHQPDRGPDRMIVATLTGAGPWLCRTAVVGMVVAREHTAAIVVAVDDIYAHLDHHRAEKAAS